MSIVSLFVVIFILWLIFFFIFLPIGIVVPSDHEFGHANSSPKKTFLALKLFASLFVSIVISMIYYFFLKFTF